MKKKILLSILMGFGFTFSAFAQIQFGARASVSRTNISDAHIGSKSRIGYQIGVLGLIPITDNYIFFFQPEVNYSAQGEHGKLPDGKGVRVDKKIFLSYINVPLNLKVYLSDSENEFFVLGGTYFGFKISEDVDYKHIDPTIEQTKYQNFDFGFSLGGGYSLSRKIEGSLIYSYGLMDQVIFDKYNTTNHTSILNLGISYFFK